MSNLENSVILPREDFLELQQVAWDQNPPSTKERIASTAQTTAVCFVMAGAFGAGTWAWAKAVDWRDERKFKREMAKAEKASTLRSV